MHESESPQLIIDNQRHFQNQLVTPLASLQVDHLGLHMGHKLRSNVYEVSAPQFDLPIVVKFARFSFEIPYLDSETSAYQWI